MFSSQQPRSRAPRSALRVLACSAFAAAALSPALYACGAAAHPPRPRSAAMTPAVARVLAPRPAEASCAAAAGSAAAQSAGLVARRIYELELASPEVRADQRQVEGYAPLLSALAAGDRAAVRAAVTSLVFSHTHVVRLRVSRGSSVLADVGGPYIIAPVAGELRLRGRTVGSYVLSVQDDLGYVKIAGRYIGYPLILRAGGARLPIEGTLPAGAALPYSGTVVYRGARFELLTLNAQAFPSGTLRVTMLVPTPSPAQGCATIRANELFRVGERVWRRFVAVSASPSGFVRTLGSLTGALVYVRSGSHQIAGSTRPGPSHIPTAGTISYRGRSYHVGSFSARGPGGQVRVYQLLAG